MMEFFVTGNPVAQGRPRGFVRNGRVGFYDPKESKEWKQIVADTARQEGIIPFAAAIPVKLVLEFRLTKPKSVKRNLPTVKPDLDNFIKAVKDGLKGIAWHDDSQVCRIVATKAYHDNPGVTIRIDEYSL